MFFFIGGLQPRRELLDPGPLPCPRCGRRAARIEQIRHYITVFFVPLIPLRRGEPYLVCENCELVQPLPADAPAGYPEAYDPGTHDGLDEQLEGDLGEESPVTCPHCGGPVEPEFDYCPFCGRKLKE